MEKAQNGKTAVITGLIISLLGAVVFGVLWASLGLMSLFLGWILGVLIGYINYGLIIVQSNLMFASDSKPLGLFLAGAAFFVRMLLYVGALFLALYLNKMGHDIFNVFTVLGGFVPAWLRIFISQSGLLKGNKNTRAN